MLFLFFLFLGDLKGILVKSEFLLKNILHLWFFFKTEIYSQSREDISETLIEKLKKNPASDANLINSDEEFKHNDEENSSESEASEDLDAIFKEIREKAKETD